MKWTHDMSLYDQFLSKNQMLRNNLKFHTSYENNNWKIYKIALSHSKLETWKLNDIIQTEPRPDRSRLN